MIEWEHLKTDKTKFIIGVFVVKKINHTLTMPNSFKGKLYDKYANRKNRCVKFVFGKNGLYVSKTAISINSMVKDVIGEDQVIAYATENVIYITPYKLGQEHLEKLIKMDK